MIEAGYTKVVTLKGGMSAWQTAGGTISTDPPPTPK
jgi:3-mercaptopyruvate sulfurtransferase SseA